MERCQTCQEYGCSIPCTREYVLVLWRDEAPSYQWINRGVEYIVTPCRGGGRIRYQRIDIYGPDTRSILFV